MNRRISFCCAAALLLLSAAPAPSALYDMPFNLRIGGEAVFVDDFRVGVEGITEGRCPAGVLCIWEGDAAVDLWGRESGKSAVAFDLHTYRLFARAYDVGVHRVIMTQVVPYPSYYEPPIEPGDYVVTLLVTRLDVVEGKAPTWGRVKALYR